MGGADVAPCLIGASLPVVEAIADAYARASETGEPALGGREDGLNEDGGIRSAESDALTEGRLETVRLVPGVIKGCEEKTSTPSASAYRLEREVEEEPDMIVSASSESAHQNRSDSNLLGILRCGGSGSTGLVHAGSLLDGGDW